MDSALLHKVAYEGTGFGICIESIVFSPDGRLIAVTSDSEPSVMLVDAVSAKVLHRHSNRRFRRFLCLAFSPDSKLLAIGSEDRTVALVSTATGAELHKLEHHDDAVECVAFSPDGNILATGSADRTVALVDLSTRSVLRTLAHHTKFICCIAFSPDGKLLATGSADCTAALVDTESWEVLRVTERHAGSIYSLAFSPDSTMLAMTAVGPLDDMAGAATVIDAASGEVVHMRLPHVIEGIKFQGVMFSPDGKLLATRPSHNAVTLLDTASGEVRHNLTPHRDGVACFAISPDGMLLATGSYDNTVALVDTASGAVLHKLEHHDRDVNCVSFSQDGKLLASGSDDGTVGLVWTCYTFWTRDMHPYLPRASRQFVTALLLCAARLARAAALATGDKESFAFPPLPSEMWLEILGFLKASDLRR